MSDEETPRERFLRLAESRTNRALEAIRTLNNLTNRRTYDWEEQDIRKISKVLRDSVAAFEANFTKPRKGESKFKLR